MTEFKEHLTIAIVGRPNVGKSTLFNRLVGRRQAIVDDQPGATVDRHYAQAKFFQCAYTVIDTGGFEPETGNDLLKNMREQSLLAIAEADIIFALFDGREGLVIADEEIVNTLRRSKKPVYWLVNKVDGPSQEANVADFYSLGIDPIYGISAEHGVNVADVLVDVERDYPSQKRLIETDENEIRVAVIGKPNVGKSTLINRLTGDARHIVTDIPGTTRDALDSVIVRDETTFRLIDTAGIRRKKKINEVIEKRTIVKALKAMDRAHVAVLMLDAEQGVTEQDQKIAAFAHDKGRAAVILVNKWDKIEKDNDTAGAFAKDIRDRLKFVPYAPILFASALTGQRAEKVLALIVKVAEQHRRRIPTGELNRWLEATVLANRPPSRKGKPLKIYYISQVDVAPPTFMLVINERERLHFSYERYLSNKLREAFGFEGTPLKMFYRNRRKGEDREIGKNQ